jgi:ABC-type cobalamin transport system ATPase subunit
MPEREGRHGVATVEGKKTSQSGGSHRRLAVAAVVLQIIP